MTRRTLARLGGLFCCVALLLVVCANAAKAGGRYAVLDAEASWLAGKPVVVDCPTWREWSLQVGGVGTSATPHPWTAGVLGYVWLSLLNPLSGVQTAHLRPDMCDNVLRLRAGLPVDIRRASLALMVLVHEAGHLRGRFGVPNEAINQCWAVTHVRRAALGLGLSPTMAHFLEAFAADWHRYAMPAEYQLQGCPVPKGSGVPREIVRSVITWE